MRLFFLLLLLSETVDRESLRFARVAEQGWDSSCGLSALSTFLGGYWDRPAGEAELALEFFADKLAAGELTVSLADLARVLAEKGFASAGYRMNFVQLGKAVGFFAPVFVHFDRPAGHFALALATDGERIVVADPAEGSLAMEREDFEARWSGKVLVAVPPGRAAAPARAAEAAGPAWARARLLDRKAVLWALGGRR